MILLVERGWEFATLLEMDLGTFNALAAISNKLHAERILLESNLQALATHDPGKLSETTEQLAKDAGVEIKGSKADAGAFVNRFKTGF